MSSEERRQILQMVEAGKISADEALVLIRELEQDVEDETRADETESGAGPETGSGFESANSAPELERTAEKARSLWQIPLWIGVGFTVLSALGMYAVMKSAAGMNFWFYCLMMPLFLGVGVIALAAWSRTAHWVFVNVDRSRSADGPRRIFIGLPLPLGLASWFLRIFGNRIEGLKDSDVDGMVQAISMVQTVHEPLIVNVDDSDDGERVQVYIG